MTNFKIDGVGIPLELEDFGTIKTDNSKVNANALERITTLETALRAIKAVNETVDAPFERGATIENIVNKALSDVGGCEGVR